MATAAEIDLSLIVEWENTHHAGASRTQEMFTRLSRQLLDYTSTRAISVELIVAYDSSDCDEDSIRALVGACWDDAQSVAPLRLVAAPRASYYMLKNRAAVEARGVLVAFIDCDVLPEADWLKCILEPFSDPSVGAVQGVTRVDPKSALERGLAVAWLFPFLTAQGELSEKGRVIANNVAFRRSVLLRHPYPALRSWRGQCTAQRRSLDAAGIVVVWSRGACTIHPFPEGLAGTVERAFLNGHDHLLRYEAAGGARRCWKATWWRYRSFVRRARRRRRLLDLTPTEVVACEIVARFYWGCAALSEIMVHLAPRLWRRLLRELPAEDPVAATVPSHTS